MVTPIVKLRDAGVAVAPLLGYVARRLTHWDALGNTASFRVCSVGAVNLCGWLNLLQKFSFHLFWYEEYYLSFRLICSCRSYTTKIINYHIVSLGC